jgi:putative flippase GtrA
VGERWQRAGRVLDRVGSASLRARFLRYTAGSAVAFVSSEVALVLCYGTGLLGSAPSSVVAWFAGAVPNYLLNRAWVWNRREGVALREELVPYAAVSLASLAVATAATTVAAWLAPGGHATKTAFVAAAYFASYAGLFVAKFALFHRVVFRERPLTPVTAASQGGRTAST